MKKTLSHEKVVVVGGAGFIGSHLVDLLIKNGYEVHVIDNLVGGKKSNLNKKAIFYKRDIRNIESIKPIFKGTKYVFHLAALPRVSYSIEFPIKTFETNVSGTLNVLEASRYAKIDKLIYSASSSAYGDQPIMPLTEDMIARPKSPYGLQKYEGELMCRLYSEIYSLPTVSLRYFNVYGPRLNPEGAHALVIGKFLKQRIDKETLTITGDGEQTRDFTHVYDVARANLLAAIGDKVGKGETLNIGAGRNISINKIASLIGGSKKYIPARLEPKNTLADNSKAIRLIGWSPTIAIEEGIKELKKIWKIK